VLTKVTAYSQWPSVDPLVLNVINRPETDLFEVRNIDGLGPVKADINTTKKVTPGSSYAGSNVGERNIVMTLGLTPNWDEWTVSKLRRHLDKYFMPQQSIRLVLETMEYDPVEISGWVEANDPNMFSKDPEHQISIICPDLYFKSSDPVVINGDSTMISWPIEYQGNVEGGIYVRASKALGGSPNPGFITFQVNEATQYPYVKAFGSPVIDTSKDVFLNTFPGDKYIQSIPNTGGVVVPTNLLNDAEIGFRWPMIGPGTESFEVRTDAGIVNWTLQYYNLFGSL